MTAFLAQGSYADDRISNMQDLHKVFDTLL